MKIYDMLLANAMMGEGGGGGGGDGVYIPVQQIIVTVIVEGDEGATGDIDIICFEGNGAVIGFFLETEAMYAEYADNLSVGTHEYKPYIFPNKTIMFTTPSSVLNTSGAITYDSDFELYTISGDCSITIRGSR